MKQHIVNNILHQTRDIYNRIASDFSQTRSFQWAGFNDFIKYVKPGDKVLDLGCGNGRLASLFSDAKISYLGIDNSEELIKIAREKYQNDPAVKFEVGDASNLSTVDGNFNVVFMIAVLHHIPDRKLRLQILRNIYDIMAPDGRLIVYNWNLWIWKYRKKYWPHLFNYLYKIRQGVWSLNDAFIPWKLKESWQPRYVHSFARREFSRLLKEAGFSIEEIYYEWQGQKTGFFKGANLVAIVRRRRS